MSEAHPGEATLTRNERLVLTTLADAGTPLGAYAILEALRGDGLRAPPQVYRALDKLQRAGLVHRIESLNAFIACSHPECEVRNLAAFVICTACGRVTEFTDADLLALAGKLAERAGMRLEGATIELKGRCTACANS
ncbi:MAG: transcriptional repressor [Rhizobiales bacterium]|nr:transcriptional repressor [Hyphomicrobiales bacterium]